MNRKQEQFLLFQIRVCGNKNAYAEIYETYYDRIYRFCRRKLPTSADTDDVVANVFLMTWNYIQATEVDHLSGLLHTIARNVVAQFYTKFQRTVSIEHTQEPVIEEGGAIEAKADVQFVQNSLAKLSEDDQRLISMKYFDQLSIREMADALQKGEGAIKTQLHRALKKLRQYL